MQTLNPYAPLVSSLLGETAEAERLSFQLEECDKEPASFFEKNKNNYFQNRGITVAGNTEQTLCYLLDVLTENGIVYELDWKADADELNNALRLLSKGKIKDNLFTQEDEEDADGMFELLDMAEDILEEYDLAIVTFPLESDSHPIALVPLSRKEEIEAMIDELF